MRILQFLMIVAVLSVPMAANAKGDSGFDLMKAALEHSNIRAEGSPSFHLVATFRLATGGKSYDGVYKELWVSQRQWRRVFEISGGRRVEVGLGEKRWVQETQELMALNLGQIVDMLHKDVLDPQFKPKGSSEKRIQNIAAQCVKLKSSFATETYCIDPTDDSVLSREYSWPSGGHESYVYKSHEKFGDHLFPRRIEYLGDNERLEVVVSEIGFESSADQSLFAPLSNALELGNCAHERLATPKVTSSPDPYYPSGQTTDSRVILSIVVDSDSRLHDFRVVNSGGMAFDNEAIRAVQRWRMEPAKCDGIPITAQVRVEVRFRRW